MPGIKADGGNVGRDKVCAVGRREPSRLVHDALDLADRVGLAVDRQQRRRLGEIDRSDDALDLGGHGDDCPRSPCAVAVMV